MFNNCSLAKKFNNIRIKRYEERIECISQSKFENKALSVLILPLLLSGLVYSVFGILDLVFKFGIIADVIASVCITGGSIAINAIIENKKYSINKKTLKEKLKSFSNAETEFDKIEEEIGYKIKLEQVKNKARVIKNREDNFLKFAISDPLHGYRDPNKSKEEIDQMLNELSNTIKDKYRDLDILTMKQVLADSYLSQKIRPLKMTLYSLLIFLFFPGMRVFRFGAALVSVLYMIKRNVDYKKAFKRLNSKLGKDAFTRKTLSSYKNEEILELINSKISDISHDLFKFGTTNSNLKRKKKEKERTYREPLTPRLSLITKQDNEAGFKAQFSEDLSSYEQKKGSTKSLN